MKNTFRVMGHPMRLQGTVWLILTKGPVAAWADRLHLNVGWAWRDEPDDSQRRASDIVILGWSRPLGTETVLVVDGLVRQDELVDGPWRSAAEVGVRRQISPLAVASLGAGADAASGGGYTGAHVTVGLQRSF